MKKFTFLLSIALFLGIGCAPRIAYMGDSYSPTYNVDVFYDINDIEQDYRVIGLARNEGDEIERDDLPSIRDAMIEKARSVGADAILFLTVAENKGGPEWDTNKIVEAKFIKYK
jgi:hypothetical protein